MATPKNKEAFVICLLRRDPIGHVEFTYYLEVVAR
jgi:hypothetical protein